MDPSLPNIDYSDFKTNPADFAEYYRGAQEQMPRDMPKARGLYVTITAFVDASFAQNKKTRKSHTGFIIFVNRAPITWHSKRQALSRATGHRHHSPVLLAQILRSMQRTLRRSRRSWLIIISSWKQKPSGEAQNIIIPHLTRYNHRVPRSDSTTLTRYNHPDGYLGGGAGYNHSAPDWI